MRGKATFLAILRCRAVGCCAPVGNPFHRAHPSMLCESCDDCIGGYVLLACMRVVSHWYACVCVCECAWCAPLSGRQLGKIASRNFPRENDAATTRHRTLGNRMLYFCFLTDSLLCMLGGYSATDVGCLRKQNTFAVLSLGAGELLPGFPLDETRGLRAQRRTPTRAVQGAYC